MSDERVGKIERFEEGFRSWGRRPSVVPPAVAAARVRVRIGAVRGASKRWHLAWLGAAVVVAVVGSWLGVKQTTHAPVPSPVAAHETVPLPDNVVLWWLDKETPVYFVIRPAQPGGGGR